MKNICLFLMAVTFAFSIQAAEEKKAARKTTAKSTTTKTVTEEPAATPSPSPAATPEPTAGEKFQEGAEKAAEGIQDAAKDVAKDMGSSAARRGDSDMVITGQYAPIDLVLPSKLGLSIGWIANARSTYELEYLKGSVKPPLIEDFGEVADTRLTLMKRSYFSSNSFNFSWGVAYMGFKGKVGDALLARLSGGAVPEIELINVESFGTHLGFGNRWVFKRGVTFGIDWFQWTQPIIVTKRDAKFLDYVSNQSDRDSIDKGLKILSYFPRFSVLKIQLGYTF